METTDIIKDLIVENRLEEAAELLEKYHLPFDVMTIICHLV